MLPEISNVFFKLIFFKLTGNQTIFFKNKYILSLTLSFNTLEISLILLLYNLKNYQLLLEYKLFLLFKIYALLFITLISLGNSGHV